MPFRTPPTRSSNLLPSKRSAHVIRAIGPPVSQAGMGRLCRDRPQSVNLRAGGDASVGGSELLGGTS